MSPRVAGALIAAIASACLAVLLSCGTPVPAAPLPHVTPSPTPAPCPARGGTRC